MYQVLSDKSPVIKGSGVCNTWGTIETKPNSIYQPRIYKYHIKILISTKPIEFSLLGKLLIGHGVV